MKSAFEANRKLWDERVAIHRRDTTGFYKVDQFLAGKDVLYPIEAAEIGDVNGLRIAHLQCHFGIDSICLARRGASVTGLDFSKPAIIEAQKLALQMQVDAHFVEGNVYDAHALLEGDFDRVYTTWGTTGWLPDVDAWARVIASLLNPGGSLYFADGHPMMFCLDMVEDQIVLRYDWRTPKDQPLKEINETTYTGDRTTHQESYEWVHPMVDILNAFISAGLRIDWIHEHRTLPWSYFPNMIEGSDRMFQMRDGYPQLPLAFSLQATKL